MKIQKKNLSLHLIKFDNYIPIFYLMLLSVFLLSIFGKTGKDKDKMIKWADVFGFRRRQEPQLGLKGCQDSGETSF